MLAVIADGEAFVVDHVEPLEVSGDERVLYDCLREVLTGLRVPLRAWTTPDGSLRSVDSLLPGTVARLSFPTVIGKRLAP